MRYPELLLCACMVFASGYQRDFGAQAEDPQKAVSWEIAVQVSDAGRDDRAGAPAR